MSDLLDTMIGPKSDGKTYTIVGFTIDAQTRRNAREYIKVKRGKTPAAVEKACKEDLEGDKMLIVVGVYEGFLQNERGRNF